MSQGPSTFGIIMTSRRLPMAPTREVMSSRHHGLSRLFTRVQSGVPPRSISRPIRIRPSRAASFLSAGMASSRLPSRMSACFAMSGSFAAIFSLEGSKKWMQREGLTGISRTGSGAPMASGFRKSRGLRMAPHVDGAAGPVQPARDASAPPVVQGRPLALRVDVGLQGALGAGVPLPPPAGHELVAQDGEDPSAEVAAGPEPREALERPEARGLDEIRRVGGGREAPERREVRTELGLELSSP